MFTEGLLGASGLLAPQTGILGPSRSKKESNLKETAKPAMVEAVRLLQGFGMLWVLGLILLGLFL